MVETKHMFFIGVALVLAAMAFIVLVGTGGTAASPASPNDNDTVGGTAQVNQLQVITLKALASGYDQETIRVKAGQPVRIDFTAIDAGCGSQLIIDKVGVNLVSRNGATVSATFTPSTPGNYPYHCGMNMFRGVLIAE